MDFRLSTALSFLSLFCLISCGSDELPPRGQEFLPLSPALPTIEVDSLDVHWVFGEIAPGQGMFQAMSDMGLNQTQFMEVYQTLSYEVEILNLKVGERLAVRWNGDSTQVNEFLYSPNRITTHQLLRDNDSLRYERFEKPTQVRHRMVTGTLRQGSTLDQTLLRGGVHPALKQVVNGVLLCKIAFNTQARQGDTFEVLLREELFQNELVPERAQVLYTRYSGVRTGTHEAFRYREEDPQSSYNAHYDESGSALIFSGLRYPLDRLHITSSYGSRRHPVTGRQTFHNGVDYRAPVGTPVFAVAPGKVIVSNYDNLSGNKIAIRHTDGTSSWYLHLSQRLVGVGASVGGRQTIARAGNTGRSTGPHLHFGFKSEKGKWIDPLSKRMIATPKLEGERMKRLKQQITEIREIFKSDELVYAEARDPRFDRSMAPLRMPWEQLRDRLFFPIWPGEADGLGIFSEL